MNLNDHAFVRDVQPLDPDMIEDGCQFCFQPRVKCRCDMDDLLPAYQGAFDTEGRH